MSRQTRWLRKRREARIGQGLCGECGKPAKGKQCDSCRDISRKRSLQRLARLRQLGLCTSCGGRRDGKRAHCAQCRERERNRTRFPGETARSAKCEMCGKDENLVRDHDHKTGLFRGWLCPLCNRCLGNARDCPSVLRAGIRYLSRSAERPDADD